MRRLFAILLSAFLVIGFAPLANAGPELNPDRASTAFTASALTPCSENSRFQERASAATTEQAKARFERYGQASCGDDGLPHLIIGPTLEPFGALAMRGHEGDVLIPAHIFIFVAGMIGWAGREYLIMARESGDAVDKEIFIDSALLQKALIKGAQWPFNANSQGRSGQLRESNKNITTSPESDYSDVPF
jgi:photosystem I subunit 3